MSCAETRIGRGARDRGEVALGLRLAGALAVFWDMKGYHTEGRGWLERALDLARRRSVPKAMWIRPLYGAAYLARNRGDYERASAHATGTRAT